ncbi:MAG: PAS domain S-box protein [Spirochaetes bacterium]|nr:PAS domain S-box protein [Spirochaetota bacterium]
MKHTDDIGHDTDAGGLRGSALDSLLRHSGEIVAVIDPGGKILYISRPVQRLLGYDDTALAGKILYDFIHPDDKEGVRTMVEKAAGSLHLPHTVQHRARHADGRWLIMESTASNRLDAPQIGGIVINSRDITGLLRTANELREEELKFRALAESTSTAIFIWQDETLVYINPAAEKLTGYSKDEFYGMKFWEIIHPEHREEALRRGMARIRGEDVPVHNIFRVMTKSGAERWADTHATLISWRGKPAVLGTAHDITEFKQAEDDLAGKASELQAIFSVLPDLFFRFDRAGTILDSLAGNEMDLILPRESFIGKNIRQVTPPFLADLTMDAIGRVLSGEARLTQEYSLQIGGREEHFEARYVPIAGDQVVAIVRNITEKKRNETEILKAQRLDSIGILAGGIAHDFNNILAAILGNISLARFYAPSGDRLHAKLDEAEKSIDRARDLARQLLTFARGGAPVKKPMCIGELVRTTVGFALSGSPVESVLDIEEGLWPVEIDEGQMHQVINNIVINAVQAMPDGGTITVRAVNVPGRGNPRERGETSPRPGDRVLVTVTDQGTGIPGEFIERIFEPYFSLKTDGTGLGLATSYSIVKRHQGTIAASSEPGRGTTISVSLPATGAVSDITDKGARGPVRGSGRILVMDDESAILDVCSEMLRRLGYDAETALDGCEALEKYREAMPAAPFAAVILDLTVRGGMGGRECIGGLLALDPAARVLVSSGYSNDPIMAEYRDCGFRGVIAKPYNIVDLSRVLHRIISE